MKVLSYLLVIFLFLVIVPQKELISLKRSIDSFILTKVLKEGFESFLGFVKESLGIDLKSETKALITKSWDFLKDNLKFLERK